MVKRLETAVRILQVQYLLKKNKCSVGYYNYVKKNAFKKMRLYKARMNALHNPLRIVMHSQEKLVRQFVMVRALVQRQQDLIRELIEKQKPSEELLQKLKLLQQALK